MPGLRLGILDFGLLRPGDYVQTALEDTIRVVRRADDLGFTRYWLGEHHTYGVPFGGSPEIFLAALAPQTKRIRLGVGALLLRYYSPLKVANTFLLLETLYPGRIDLGVASSRANVRESDAALLRTNQAVPSLFPPEEFLERTQELLGFLRGNFPDDHLYMRAACNPRVSSICQTWVCGTSNAGAVAAQLGVAYCTSLFHGGKQPSADYVRLYRETFQASQELPRPLACIAVCGACVQNERRGRRIRDEWDQEAYPPNIIGSPQRWQDELMSFVETYHPDEIIVLEISRRLRDRLRSLELLADTFALKRLDAARRA